MSEFLRWGELLLGLIHLSLMLDKRLFHGLYVSSFTTFRVYSHLSLHEIARQQHAHLVLIYMKAMCIMILLEEVDTVDRIFVLHAVVNLEIVNDNIFGLQPTGHVIVSLT